MLDLGVELLMSEESYEVPGLRPAVGRLVNALVAVLGPELTPGSNAYSKCKALIREMQVRIIKSIISHNRISSKGFLGFCRH